MYPSGDLDLALISPSGARFDANTVIGSAGIAHEEQEILGGIIEVFSIETPELGTWTVEVSAPLVTDPSGSVSFSVNAWLENPSITFDGMLAKANIHLNETLQLLGTAKENGAPLIGATVVARIALPDDSVVDVTLLDDGTGIDAAANDGIYTGQLTNTPLPGNYRINFVASRTGAPGVVGFSREDFELATVSSSSSTIAGPFTDFGLDTDGDGFFNSLVVEVGLDITTQAHYRVLGILKDANGNTLDASAEADLDVGANTIGLKFDGEKIFNNRVDGPYQLSVVRLAEESDLETLPVDEKTDAHQTAAYSFRAFAHPPITLTGNGSASGVDTDGDGFFDLLDVVIEVEVTNSGSYEWSARLTDKNGTEIGFASSTGSFNAGANNLTFTFAGEPIGQNGVDGPYFVRGLLVNGGGDSLVASDAFTTGAFLASQFEGFVAPNQPPVANAGADKTVNVGSLVMLEGTGSSDPDSGPAPLAYTWTQTGGPAVTLNGPDTPVPTFTPTIVETYTFSLTVSDGQDTSLPDDVVITVIHIAFATFIPKLEIEDDDNEFELKATFTLGTGNDSINPITENVSFTIGNYAATLPPGSFKKDKKGWFKFEGMINGVVLEIVIRPLRRGGFEFKAEGSPANVIGSANPVPVVLTIGNDSGSASVKPEFDD